MAKRVGNKLKSCRNQAILSHNSRQTNKQNKANPKNKCGVDWAWDDEGILAPVRTE